MLYQSHLKPRTSAKSMFMQKRHHRKNQKSKHGGASPSPTNECQIHVDLSSKTTIPSDSNEILIANRWRTGTRIGRGAFGTVFRGFDISSKEQVVVKIEKNDGGNKKTLRTEVNVYRDMQSNGSKRGNFPRAHFYAEYLNAQILVLDYKGQSLTRLLKKGGDAFSFPRTISYAVLALQEIKNFHSKGYVHRDIKPCNFLMDSDGKVSLIDFGLSVRYLNNDGSHCKIQEGSVRAGTPLFMSLNTHFECAPSRRDDIESLLYNIVYMYKGSRFWEKYLKNIQGESLEERFRFLKLSIPIYELFKGMPEEIIELYKYVRGLSYDETPNYDMIEDMLEFSTLDYETGELAN